MRVSVERRDQAFNFDCVKFEMPPREPTGDGKQLVKGRIQAGVIHLRVAAIWMLLKVIILEEISKEYKRRREKD